MSDWAAKVCLAFGLALIGGAAAACPDSAEHEVLASWWREAAPEQINACVDAGMAPSEALEYAASFNQDVGVVKALVAAIPDNPDPSSKAEALFGGKEGYWLSRALAYAAAFNQNAEVATGLITAGADVNASLPSLGEGFGHYTEEAVLHYALRLNGNSAVALALVHAGADPRVRDIFFNTPLHHAANHADDPAVIAALIAAGADVNARNNFGAPPPPLGDIPSLGRNLGETPLMLAACCNANPAIAAALIAAAAQVRTHGGGQLSTPLHYAAAGNAPTVVRTLLEAGADPNAANLRVSGSWNNSEDNDNGCTPLHYAVRDNEDAAVTALLIAAGADVNAKTEKDATPLQFALDNPNAQVAEALVKAGARR